MKEVNIPVNVIKSSVLSFLLWTVGVTIDCCPQEEVTFLTNAHAHRSDAVAASADAGQCVVEEKGRIQV